MKCPSCQNTKTGVVDSRYTNTSTRRRRICRVCDHRFTTHEEISDGLGENKLSKIRRDIQKLVTYIQDNGLL